MLRCCFLGATLNLSLVSFNDFTKTRVECRAVLSSDELVRADRFVREQDARAYLISHAELRRLLGEHLNVAPEALVFEVDAHGKPFLVSDNENTHFNISHSGDYALIGIGEVPVGVDIERISDKSDYLAIAERFFTNDEYLYIVHQPVNRQLLAFYQVWTLKEAYVKALGRGLGYGLDTFSVVGHDMQWAPVIGGAHIKLLTAPDGYVAAACSINK